MARGRGDEQMNIPKSELQSLILGHVAGTMTSENKYLKTNIDQCFRV